MSQEKTFAIFFNDGGTDVSSGEDPLSAVIAYYDSLDSYCSPEDDSLCEPFFVAVSEVDEDDVDQVDALFDSDIDDDERLEKLRDLAGSKTWHVQCEYREGELHAKLIDPSTNP